MAKADILTLHEKIIISKRLEQISETWSDLWMVSYYTGISAGRLITIKYTDFDGRSINFFDKQTKSTTNALIGSKAAEVINKRKHRLPNDIYIFQSHSNRVKNRAKPVSLIAFNIALKEASIYLYDKNVSSLSAIKNSKACL